MILFDIVLEVLHMPDWLPGSWIKHEVFSSPRKMLDPRWYRTTSLAWKSSTIRTVQNMKRLLNTRHRLLSKVGEEICELTMINLIVRLQAP